MAGHAAVLGIRLAHHRARLQGHRLRRTPTRTRTGHFWAKHRIDTFDHGNLLWVSAVLAQPACSPHEKRAASDPRGIGPDRDEGAERAFGWLAELRSDTLRRKALVQCLRQ